MANSRDFAVQVVWETQDADSGLIKTKCTLERKASMASSTLSHSFQTEWHPSQVLSRERHMTAKCWTTAAGCKFWRKKQQRGECGFYLAMLVLPSVNTCNQCIEHFPATSCATSGLSTTICWGSESTLRITCRCEQCIFVSEFQERSQARWPQCREAIQSAKLSHERAKYLPP